MATHEVAHEMSADIFPFEKLPPELRNMIHEIVLLAGKTVRVHRRISGARMDHALRATTTVLRKNNRSTITIPFLDKHGTAILRINKLAYREAMPILYGGRILVFNTNPSLRQFFEECPGRLQYIQHIKLSEGATTKLGKALSTLRDTSGLQRLEICLDSWQCACRSAESLLQDLPLPGVKKFVLLGRTAEAIRQRLDVLSFTVSINPCHNHQSSDGIDVAVCAQRAIEIKALVVRALMHQKAVIKRMGTTLA